MACLCAWADIPLKLVNNSEGQFADNEIYVAIIGKVGEGTMYTMTSQPRQIRDNA